MNYGDRFTTFLHAISWRLGNFVQYLIYQSHFYRHRKDLQRKLKLDPSRIPVIISNYNRLDSLDQMIEWISNMPKTQIIVLDNGSVRSSTLKYYQRTKHEFQIIRGKNYQDFRELFALSKIVSQNFTHYVITDSDLLPYSYTPDNLINQCIKVLEAFPQINHVGPSLNVSDLPENEITQEVRKWESHYWIHEAEDWGYYAPIDTTFAVYRNSSFPTISEGAIRLKPPYVLKHLDWYEDYLQPSEEFAGAMDGANRKSSWIHYFKRLKFQREI